MAIEGALPIVIPILHDVHAVMASQRGRELCRPLNFSAVEQTALSTAILEIARNIVKYAETGTVTLDVLEENGKCGVRVVATDSGPGIPDLELAMKDGFSTGRSLGLGLPGAKRLMSDFNIQSEVGKGTTVTMIKWKSAYENSRRMERRP